MTVSGTVWTDQDADGVQDGGSETGLAGVTVALLDGGGSVLASQATNAGGGYTFAGVRPGAPYRVRFTLPGGYVFSPLGVGGEATDSDANTTTGETESFTPLSGATPDYDAGLFQYATISGMAWHDLNADGVQNGVEVGLSGVTVDLLDGGGSVVATWTTDASGGYTFDTVWPGAAYHVRFTLPGGHEFSPQGMGGDPNLDSDANTTTGETGSVTPQSGQGFDFDAGAFARVTISGIVWHDLNGNGVQDGGGEVPLIGVTVRLWDGGSVIGSQSTDTSGYSFGGLLPGVAYHVQVVQPAGYQFTLQDQGDDTFDSDVDSGGNTLPFTPDSGALEVRDAGAFQPVTVSGTIWHDLDANGQFDAGEPGLGGVALQLEGDGGALLVSQTSAGDGSYSFTDTGVPGDGLPPGIYRVHVAALAAYQLSPKIAGLDSDADPVSGWTDAVTLESGQSTGFDAGQYTTAAIGDFVWDDLNANGLQDPGEPGLDGVTVTLYDSGGPAGTTTTSGGGAYGFGGLQPGDYYLNFALLPGFEYSRVDAGDDALDSDADELVSGMTTTYTLISGETDDTVDAGMYQLAAIGGTVWQDLNNNGLQDAGEPGDDPGFSPGLWEIELRDSTDTTIATTVPDASGNYSFSSLVPGSYSVYFNWPALGDLGSSAPNVGADDTIDSDPVSLLAGPYVLVSGENNVSVDAGFWWRGLIMFDYAWEDLNNNGTQESGENTFSPGTLNVTWYAADGTPLSTFSDVMGVINVVPGDYYVIYDLLPGYAFSPVGPDSDVDATGRYDFTLLSSGSPTIQAGEYPLPAAVAGRAWHDLNADGVQDPGEPGYGGVGVTIYDALLAPVDSTTTDGNGDYSLIGLSYGDYLIAFSPPGLEIFSPQGQAGPALDSDPDSDGWTAVFSLAAGETRTDIDAGLWLQASITGRVWLDENGDGIQDLAEPGLDPGFGGAYSIDLYRVGVGVVASTYPDNGGNYFFAGVLPDTYHVLFNWPVPAVPDLRLSPANQGTDEGLDSDPDPVTWQTDDFTVQSGALSGFWDAGWWLSTSVQFNDLWLDSNGDGMWSKPGEMAYTGAYTITVYRSSNNSVVYGDTAGFTLTDLTGSYYVIYSLPSGYAFTAGPDSVVNASGRYDFTLVSGDSLVVGAGLYPLPGTISGRVWQDLNADGIRNPGETSGIDGMSVRLYDAVAGPPAFAHLPTSSNGLYSFGSVPPGDYYLIFDIGSVAGGPFYFSPQNAGDDALDSDPDSSGLVASFTLAPGETIDTIDAGVWREAEIDVTDAWEDQNLNTFHDPGEPFVGPESCSVDLYTSADALIHSDLQGFMEFVPPGDYYVTYSYCVDYFFVIGGDSDIATVSPDGITGRTANFTVQSNDIVTISGGVIPAFAVYGLVWDDLNGDGIQSPGESGLSGVEVWLEGGSAPADTTDGFGTYWIYVRPDLPSIRVQVVLPPGYVFSPLGQGSDPLLDSDIYPATGLSDVITPVVGGGIVVDAGMHIMP